MSDGSLDAVVDDDVEIVALADGRNCAGRAVGFLVIEVYKFHTVKWRKRHETSRRRFLHLAAGAAALPAVSRFARAQTYPTRPVRLVVGFAAGGAPTSSRA